MNIKTNLLHVTPKKVINRAISLPYNSKPSDELTKKVICIKKHLSCAEHITMNFHIEDISRLCLQELVRHRMSSFTVESTRYTLQKLNKAKKPDNFFNRPEPEDIDNLEVKETIQQVVRIQNAFFYAYKLLNRFFPKMSNALIKYALPEGYKCSLLWTVNLRSFLNFLDLRLDKHAHFEIRYLAQTLLDEIKNDSSSQYVYNLIKGIRKDL